MTPLAVRAILGPCRCQGCGEDVLYVRQARRRGWLHANGNLVCPGRRVLPAGLSKREYNRLWMRQKRAAA